MENNKKKGFTLTEILVVIVIIGIVLTIAIPRVVIIRKRINNRLYEEKKHLILVAAELYGKDKGLVTDSIITIDRLLETKYINPDLKTGEKGCSNEHGCIVDPTTNEIINNTELLLKKNNTDVVAVWNGQIASTSSRDIIDTVKEALSCPATVTASSPCLYPADATNNYIYISGVMWRIVGIYNIDSTEVVKLITDDTITWEAE